MNAAEYWKMFLETGAPEVYLMYTSALKMEEANVSDHQGNRPQSDGLW